MFLGFHSFGLYIYNDTMQALGRPQDMFSDTAIQLQPIFCPVRSKHPNFSSGTTAPNQLEPSIRWGGGVVAVGGKLP